MPWELEYFEQQSGRQPAEVFEGAIPGPLRMKLIRFAEEVAVKEGQIGGGIWKPCRGHAGLFAVRVICGNDLGRYYTAVIADTLVLLHGYKKKPGQQTPPAVYREAEGYLADYRVNRRTSPEAPEEEIG